MLNNPIIFYTIALITIVFGILTICLRNLIYSLLSAIVVFYSIAVIFYLLGSEYNAIIQAAIYGLAVPVIIGLSIMFTIRKEEICDCSKFRNIAIPYIALLGSAVFVLALCYLIVISLLIVPESLHIMPPGQINSFDVLNSFAKGIFVNYVWAFELVSLLLTIIVAGIVMISKRGCR